MLILEQVAFLLARRHVNIPGKTQGLKKKKRRKKQTQRTELAIANGANLIYK